MKKILIVDVPDDATDLRLRYQTNKVHRGVFNFAKVTEFIPPTDEEIYEASKNPKMLHPLNSAQPAYRIGAKWFKSLLK